MHFKCDKSDECQTYDKNRVCDSGQCVCGDGYIPNTRDFPYDQLCIVRNISYGKTCDKDFQCYQKRQRCVDRKCICDPNTYYYFDPNGHEAYDDCEYFANCTQDVNKTLGITCDEGLDTNRVCNGLSGKCECNEGFVEDKDNGRKCSPNSSLSYYSNSYYNLLILLIIPYFVVW